MEKTLRTKSLYFEKPYHVTIRDEQLQEPADDELLVRSSFSSVSTGSELLLYRGEFEEGSLLDTNIPVLRQPARYPCPYGYSVTGIVERHGRNVDPKLAGARVFAFHPHRSRFVVKATDALPLPDDIDLAEATFIPAMETAVNLVMDGAPLPGEKILILGQGLIGLLTGRLLSRMSSFAVFGCDRHARRLALAKEWAGCTPVQRGNERDLQALRAGLGPRGFDLCYELTGDPAAIGDALAHAGFGSRIVIGSWYGARGAGIRFGDTFHRGRIRISSSQVSTIDPALAGRWDKPRRLALALEMIRATRPRALISARVPFEEAASAYRILDRSPAEHLHLLLTYNQKEEER